MTPEMNTVGLGGLKKKRDINCTNYLEGKNEMHFKHAMQRKWYFWQLMSASNRQKEFCRQ